MESTYHYPPDLFNLLIETIPQLCPRKRDLITFFRGAGVSSALLSDVHSAIRFHVETFGAEMAMNE